MAILKKILKSQIFYLSFFSSIFIFFLLNGFLHSRTVSHDTIWCYGLIDYFFTFLDKGVYPFWDIYNYSGQPFFYNIGITRIYEPQTIALVFLNKLTNFSFLTLYHIDFILRLIIISLGVYLCYSLTNRHFVSNILVYVVFLFSSFSFLSMWQPGFVTTFMWTPYAVYFLLKIKKEASFYNVLGLFFFLGLSMASYQGGYVLTFFSFLLVIFIRPIWLSFSKNKHSLFYLTAGFLIFLSLSLHVFSLYPERIKTDAVIRAIGTDSDKKEEFGYTVGGVSSEKKDLLELFKTHVFDPKFKYEINENISEAFVSIGIFAFLLAIIGLFFGKGVLRFHFLILSILTVFLMLDGRLIFGRYANYVFPFLSFSKHMQLFQPFFIFSLMYFVGQGSDFLLDIYISKNKIEYVTKP